MLLDRLRHALPDLPPQLAAAGRFLAADPTIAATSSMRALAAAAGASPASFTRLAQALGFSGWEELRAAAVAELRPPPAPYSARAPLPGEGVLAAFCGSDAANLSALAAQPNAALADTALAAAAAALHAAPRIHVAGFRSCRAVAELLAYQLRLFRPQTHLLGEAVLDLELATFQPGEALVLVGFYPYSRASIEVAAAAHAAGVLRVVLADAPQAPIAEGAAHLLCFPIASPSFFPSLTAATALAQALAGAVFTRGGAVAAEALRRSEARLAAHYLPDELPDYPPDHWSGHAPDSEF